MSDEGKDFEIGERVYFELVSKNELERLILECALWKQEALAARELFPYGHAFESSAYKYITAYQAAVERTKAELGE